MPTSKFYTDPAFNSRHEQMLGTQSATLTASGTNTLATVFSLPPFIRNQKVSYVRVRTVGTTAATGSILVFTFVGPSDTVQGVSGPTGTGAAVTTNTLTMTPVNTAGSFVDGVFTQVLTAPYPGGTQTNTIDVAMGSNTPATVTYIGTGTASAQSIGTYVVSLELSEEFVG